MEKKWMLKGSINWEVQQKYCYNHKLCFGKKSYSLIEHLLEVTGKPRSRKDRKWWWWGVITT